MRTAPMLWCEVRDLFFAWRPWRFCAASLQIAVIVDRVDAVNLSGSVPDRVTTGTRNRQRDCSLCVQPMPVFKLIAPLIPLLFAGVQRESNRVDGEFASRGVSALDPHNVLPPNEVMSDSSILHGFGRSRELHLGALVVEHFTVLYTVCEFHDDAMDVVTNSYPSPLKLR